VDAPEAAQEKARLKGPGFKHQMHRFVRYSDGDEALTVADKNAGGANASITIRGQTFIVPER
jgi:hypothetical protein